MGIARLVGWAVREDVLPKTVQMTGLLWTAVSAPACSFKTMTEGWSICKRMSGRDGNEEDRYLVHLAIMQNSTVVDNLLLGQPDWREVEVEIEAELSTEQY